MFHDAQYVKWANEETIHLLSYSLDKNAESPEPLLSVERYGEKVDVLAAYPMFTPSEAGQLVDEIDAHVTFTLKAPWVGVLATDGTTILASGGRGTSKEYRELYEAERKKVGAAVPRELWKKVVATIEASATASGDEKWRDAVRLALEARTLVKAPPPALEERLAARVAALDGDGRRALEKAQRLLTTAERDKAIAAVHADFAGLPFLAAESSVEK